MVGIYLPVSTDGYEFCHPDRHEDFETINANINGVSRCDTWNPIEMKLIHEDEGIKLAESDSPWIGSHALVFRRAVIDRLGCELGRYCEFLPVFCPEDELFLFNVTYVVDALDEDASSMVRFKNGRIMKVNKYAFRFGAVAAVGIFKIPNLRVSPTFFSERIVNLWKSVGLQGLEFVQVWSSE